MKYLPTINLWDPAISAALRTGNLKLQKGQWCRCGENSKISRYVCNRANGKSIWVAHNEGKTGTSKSFKRLCDAM